MAEDDGVARPRNLNFNFVLLCTANADYGTLEMNYNVENHLDSIQDAAFCAIRLFY